MTFKLSRSQECFFYDQGYLHVPGVVDRDELSRLRSESAELVEISRELRSATNPAGKVFGLADRSPVILDTLLGSERLIGTLESLLGPNIVLLKNRHNHLTVNDRVGDPAEGLHRDVLQLTRSIITVVIYLDDAEEANGATRIVPGSHRFPYVGVPQLNGGGTWLSEHSEYDGFADQALTVPVRAGGALLFNALLFHGAGANRTGKRRISVTLGFRSDDELENLPDFERIAYIRGNHLYRGNDQ